MREEELEPYTGDTSSPFGQLSDEMALHILSFFNQYEPKKLRPVSRKFRRLCDDPILQRDAKWPLLNYLNVETRHCEIYALKLGFPPNCTQTNTILIPAQNNNATIICYAYRSINVLVMDPETRQYAILHHITRDDHCFLNANSVVVLSENTIAYPISYNRINIYNIEKGRIEKTLAGIAYSQDEYFMNLLVSPCKKMLIARSLNNNIRH